MHLSILVKQGNLSGKGQISVSIANKLCPLWEGEFGKDSITPNDLLMMEVHGISTGPAGIVITLARRLSWAHSDLEVIRCARMLAMQASRCCLNMLEEMELALEATAFVYDWPEIKAVIARTILNHPNDKRIKPENKKWAAVILAPSNSALLSSLFTEPEFIGEVDLTDRGVRIGLVDLLADILRNAGAVQHTADKSKVVIVVEGGMVRNVWSLDKDLDVEVVDLDTDTRPQEEADAIHAYAKQIEEDPDYKDIL